MESCRLCEQQQASLSECSCLLHVCGCAAEDLEESAVLELHAACHAASLSKSSGDRASVPGWKTFRDSICELASEVRQVAAPDLYPAEANAASAMPPPEVQQQQLLGITQVRLCFYADDCMVLQHAMLGDDHSMAHAVNPM